ncbi:mycofactocin-coupled SDR family oxidoreductase [Nocardia alni]|uniref:mycofactocin-coupled SDR family oxidoreductase n=1 Tax=Nocardia alni TaxID=2815723 RepID=UPI001C229C5A|nr:mycofactocin-coupled SDR family oxidoreductase [Nocardia alni]
MGRLVGKVAFITGAARGQGRAHAVRLAQEGADIIAVDLLDDILHAHYPGADKADLDETVRLVQEQDRRIIATKADVRELGELRSAVDQGVAELGRLDIVVANAGVLTTLVPAADIEEEDWMHVIDVNLSGVWRTVKVAAPHIRAGGRGGSIILTSSSVALRASRNTANYVASKAGVHGLMQALAIEFAAENIRVNSVNPTQVDTPMIQHQTMYEMWRPDLDAPTREDFATASTGKMALPVPWVDPTDIANAVAFLASDEARYITGLAMKVDAGITIN